MAKGKQLPRRDIPLAHELARMDDDGFIPRTYGREGSHAFAGGGLGTRRQQYIEPESREITDMISEGSPVHYRK